MDLYYYNAVESPQVEPSGGPDSRESVTNKKTMSNSGTLASTHPGTFSPMIVFLLRSLGNSLLGFSAFLFNQNSLFIKAVYYW